MNFQEIETLMDLELENKSSVEEIRHRFDRDVERFSNLTTGQQAIMDAPQMMALISEAAAACNPDAQHLLDIGCGAGNFTLSILQRLGTLNCDLVDLSAPMLARAVQRISQFGSGSVHSFQDDIRKVELPDNRYNIIVAAAVLHHLRDDADWLHTFKKLFTLCAPGGSIWIADLVRHESRAIEQVMDNQYRYYLERIGGPRYRDKVLSVIKREDSPRPLSFQLEMLKNVGFEKIEILHKNACYAAFCACKPSMSQREKS